MIEEQEQEVIPGPVGIIQSRGLGDIMIALPIAYYFLQKGHKIIWPICEEFYPSFKDTVSWVEWVPIPTDKAGKFFYDRPYFELGSRGCTEFICLYQSLTGHPELSGRNYFQIQKFDEHKYTAAGVPFLWKWKLRECINRNEERENDLYKKLVSDKPYYVTHLKGSSYTANIDLSHMPEDWQRIDVDDNITENIFDWIKVIEHAQALITVDSAISNMVDQFNIPVDKYWIPRSHIHITPVLGSDWTILAAPPDSLAAKEIFQSAK